MKKTDFMKMTNCEWFKFDMLSQWSMLNDKGYEIFDSHSIISSDTYSIHLNLYSLWLVKEQISCIKLKY